jgi:hypothetical protein
MRRNALTVWQSRTNFGRFNMRKLLLCAVFAPAIFSSAALAQQDHSNAPIVLAQVGIGTPDCHTQGTLYRMANHCPPEAIAAARQHHPTVTQPVSQPKRYFSRW